MDANSRAEIRVGTAKTISSLNPFRAETAYEFRMLDWVLTPGTRRHPQTGAFVPWAFEDWTLPRTDSPEPTVSVRLRDDLEFSDGVDVTAEDVVFTTRLYQNYTPAGTRSSRPHEHIEQVTVPDADDRRVEFTVEEPNPDVLRSIFRAVLPKHRWERVTDVTDPSEPIETLLVGAGPLVLEDASADTFEFSSRPPSSTDWLTAECPWLDAVGPFLDGVRVEQFESTTALIRAVRSGDVNVTLESLDSEAMPDTSESSSLERRSSPAGGWSHVSFNTRRPPLDDAAFRRLLVRTFDVSFAVEQSTEGTRLLPGDYVTPPRYDEWRPPAPTELDEFDGEPVPSLQFPGRDGTFELDADAVTRVRQSLQRDDTDHEYEFVVHPNGPADDGKMLTVDGMPFPAFREAHAPDVETGSLTLLAPPVIETESRARLAREWIESLDAVGIPARVEHVPLDERIERAYEHHAFDAVMAGWGDTSALNTHYTRMFSSAGVRPQGEVSYNPMGYEGADDLIERQRTTLDPEVRRRIVKQILVTIWRDAPTLVVGYERPMQPVSTAFRGYVPASGGVANAYTWLALRESNDETNTAERTVVRE